MLPETDVGSQPPCFPYVYSALTPYITHVSNKHVTSKCNVGMACRVQWRVILCRGFALQIRGWPLLLSSDTLCGFYSRAATKCW